MDLGGIPLAIRNGGGRHLLLVLMGGEGMMASTACGRASLEKSYRFFKISLFCLYMMQEWRYHE
jgi:hypothetical protein